MAKKLFEYAVIYHPKAKEDGEEPDEQDAVVVPVTVVLARDEREVTLIAARAIPESFDAKLDRLEVAVRPF